MPRLSLIVRDSPGRRSIRYYGGVGSSPAGRSFILPLKTWSSGPSLSRCTGVTDNRLSRKSIILAQRRQGAKKNKTRFSSHYRAKKQFKLMVPEVLVLTGEAEKLMVPFAPWRLCAMHEFCLCVLTVEPLLRAPQGLPFGPGCFTRSLVSLLRMT